MPQRPRLTIPRRKFRTGVGNASKILAGVDGRSFVARRYREVVSAIASDLGGYEHLSEATRQLIRSGAGLVVMRETMDARMANAPDTVDVPTYCLITNSLKRVLCAIGLERRARDITPDPLEYARRYAEAGKPVQ